MENDIVILREKAQKLAFDYLRNKQIEHQIILFEENNKVNFIDVSSNPLKDNVDFSLDSLLENKYRLEGKHVYIAHNHPSGIAKPSMCDFAASKEFSSLLRLNNIYLMEEFIVTTNDVISYQIPGNNHAFTGNEISTTFGKSNRTNTFQIEEFSSKDKESIQNKIYRELLNGNEIAISHNNIYISDGFTFQHLQEITNNLNEVVIFGFPFFSTAPTWRRIEDINNVFGSIETYSLTEQQTLIALKKELVL